MNPLKDPDYTARQDHYDAEYVKAWDNAPDGFKESVKALGMKGAAHVDTQCGTSMEYKENFSTSSYRVDMADHIDTEVDRLIEEHGSEYEDVIISVVRSLQAPMEKEIEFNRSMMLGRVAGFLVRGGDSQNILARIHSLLHAVPGLAESNGIKSLRESARRCGCSPTWIKDGRDKWCVALGIPVPEEGKKTDEAKEGYKSNAIVNHWTKQKFVAKTSACKKTKKQVKQLPGSACPQERKALQ